MTDEEWREVRRHCEAGYIILSSSSEYIPFAEDVLYPHERFPIFWGLRIEEGKVIHGGRIIKD